MENIIRLHNYHRDDYGPFARETFYILFALTVIIFPYLIHKLIKLSRQRVRNYVVIYYYMNISFMLIGRAVYFSDAFAWHYSDIAMVWLATFPVVFLFTAGLIVSYYWIKLTLLFKHANHDIKNFELNLTLNWYFKAYAAYNGFYYSVYITFVILGATKVIEVNQLVTILWSMQAWAMIIASASTLVRGIQIRRQMTVIGVPWPRRLLTVCLIFNFTLFAHAIADVIILLFLEFEVWDLTGIDIGMNIFAIFYYILWEILPVFIILTSIKSGYREYSRVVSSLSCNSVMLNTTNDFKVFSEYESLMSV